MSVNNWVILALALVWLVFAIRVFGRFYPPERHFAWARFIARVAIFGAISTILYVVPIFQIKLVFLPSFLELHFDEIPAFIAGFAYGPLTGLAVLFIKTLIKLPFSSTLTVGEWSDLLYSAVYVLSACLIYKKMRNLKGVALGFLVGTILQILVTSLVNVTVTLPFYMRLFGMSYGDLLALCQKANPAIKDLTWGYIFYVNLPLNAIKDALVIVATFLIYRSIHKLLRYDAR
jgi:riboflavin transporter FmnP